MENGINENGAGLPVMKPHNPKKYVTRKGQW
jgi:hypothetical protein